jgi:murein DD-endopeptidase MepM/ murein hydrolase activator NlpD
MFLLLLMISLLAPSSIVHSSCPGLSLPVDGAIVRPYAPAGRYAGHWGVDIATAPGTPVEAAEAGTVTFAGQVAGVNSVTIDHGGGLRTSYSYLRDIEVPKGRWVAAGAIVGRSGLDHELAVVHFSVRIGTVYQDPKNWLACLSSPQPALHLVSSTAA